MIEFKGKGGIAAKIVADSVSPEGVRLTTFEIDFHRYVLAENNTHRMLSKNAASSRAIPLKTAIENVRNWKVEPIKWGANQAGMQSKDEEIADIAAARAIWDEAREAACRYAEKLGDLGLHKQWASRLLEPFGMVKMVESGTEWANFLWLRNHGAAQPEMAELAMCIDNCLKASTPIVLDPGDWHVPYFNNGYWLAEEQIEDASGNLVWYHRDEKQHPGRPDYHSLDDALKISSSCCAQVSYRKHDDTLEKAVSLYDRLVGADRKHASPFEHQATPIDMSPGALYDENKNKGITHYTNFKRNDTWSVHHGNVWSGNLRGWIQHRQLIPGHVVW